MLQQKTNCQGAVRLLPRPIQPREGMEARAFCASFRAITRPRLEKKTARPGLREKNQNRIDEAGATKSRASFLATEATMAKRQVASVCKIE